MKAKRGFTIAAAIIMGITILYWLVQGLLSVVYQVNATEVVYQSLIPAVIMIGLLVLSLRKPLLGGILTATFGILMAVYFLMVKLDIYQAYYFLLPMCVPLALSGLLFIEADWSEKKKTI